MSTSTTCRRCGGEFQMTRISMIDGYDLCCQCREDEDEDGTLIVSTIFKERGYKYAIESKWCIKCQSYHTENEPCIPER